MKNTEFNKDQYTDLLSSGYKFVEIVATGKEVETSEDCFKKEVILRAYKVAPAHSSHYVMEIEDHELTELVQGTDTDIFYVDRT